VELERPKNNETEDYYMMIKRITLVILTIALSTTFLVACKTNAPSTYYEINQVTVVDSLGIVDGGFFVCGDLKPKTVTFMGKEYVGTHTGTGFYYDMLNIRRTYYLLQDGGYFITDLEEGLVTLVLSKNVPSIDGHKLTNEQYYENAREILKHISKDSESYKPLIDCEYDGTPNVVEFVRSITVKSYSDHEKEYLELYTSDNVTITMDENGDFFSFEIDKKDTLDRFVGFDLRMSFDKELTENILPNKLDEISASYNSEGFNGEIDFVSRNAVKLIYYKGEQVYPLEFLVYLKETDTDEVIIKHKILLVSFKSLQSEVTTETQE
jgi:hypothetical protein